MPPHEECHVFVVWSPNMATAVMAINRIGCFHLLQHFVPAGAGDYWLVFKDDSWLKTQWNKEFPDATVLPRD